jgi:predicted ATP-dependent Lon-type protease
MFYAFIKVLFSIFLIQQVGLVLILKIVNNKWSLFGRMCPLQEPCNLKKSLKNQVAISHTYSEFGPQTRLVSHLVTSYQHTSSGPISDQF